MPLTPTEKKSIADESAIFLRANAAESSAAVKRATEIIATSRNVTSEKEMKALKEVRAACLYNRVTAFILLKVVKAYLYNARMKRPAVLKVAGRHKESPLRLWQKAHREFIQRKVPEIAGDREITPKNRLAIHGEAARKLWAQADPDERREYKKLADALNAGTATVEEKRKWVHW